LRGLDPEARTQLAERILESHVPRKAAALRLDEDFGRLMKVLAGYPLAMEVVLPNLKTQSPSEILVALQAADIDLDVESEDKTKSILKCVEYSHSNLSESAQKLLLCLAPFSGFIHSGLIPIYAKELQKLEPFRDYDFTNFDGAIQEAMHWGLLEAMDEGNRLLTIQPVFPYFLKTKLASLDEVTRKALQEGFKNHYQGLASSYNQLMESKDPQERQMGIFFCRLEYENLYNALQTCLANQESISIFFCLDKYFEVINDIQSGLKIAEDVNQAINKYSDEILQGEFGNEARVALDYLANTYLQTKQYTQARKSYEKELELLESLQFIDERQRGLSKASTYHQLGIVAQKLREYAEARQNYQQAIAIYVEFGDRYSQAMTYHQLGRVAEELREYAEARQNYQQALAICIEFGDRYSQAMTYHQLGIVAQELREYAEARQNYQQALAIFIEFGDRYSQASTYFQLGKVAEELGEIGEAKSNYLLDLQITAEFNDEHGLGISFRNLGRFYQTTQDASLLELISQVLGISVDQARQQLESS
jgi:tetratricopeptide (TPR) repeat protein